MMSFDFSDVSFRVSDDVIQVMVSVRVDDGVTVGQYVSVLRCICCILSHPSLMPLSSFRVSDGDIQGQ